MPLSAANVIRAVQSTLEWMLVQSGMCLAGNYCQNEYIFSI